MKPPYVPGKGPLHPKLVILSDFPHEPNQQFTDGEELALEGICEEAGFKSDQCYITTISKYHAPQNDIKRLGEIGVDIRQCIKELWTEIHNIRPNCILALGESALSAVTSKEGITKFRGSILPS